MLMKRKVRIPWFPIGSGLFFLLFSVPQLLPAQEERDSIRITHDRTQVKPENIFQLPPIELFFEKSTTSFIIPAESLSHSISFIPEKELYLPYPTNPSPMFRGDYHTNGVLRQFRHGLIFGSGRQTTLPGIGRFNEASLGYQHAFSSKLALQFSVNAMKINMPHLTGQAFSASGALLYHPSERVTLKLFGSYDLGNSYGMSTHSYGATVAVDMSERFNLEMGVQRYYDAMTGRWETVPVVIPSYRFNKFTLGLDVGGIVYEVLRSLVFDRERNSNPTVAPPRFSMPGR